MLQAKTDKSPSRGEQGGDGSGGDGGRGGAGRKRSRSVCVWSLFIFDLLRVCRGRNRTVSCGLLVL